MFYETKKDLGLSCITIGCPKCGGHTKKNGRRGKHQCYLCLNCRFSFIRQHHSQTGLKQFRQFYQLITGKVNRSQLWQQNRQSRKSLSIIFQLFFSRPLSAAEVWEVLPPKLSTPWVYGVDGKWLKRLGVFMLHRNITTRENLYWSFNPSESYLALSLDLAKLIELLGGGVKGESKESFPIAAISDWKGAIVSAITAAFGDIPHQRCLTHVTRTAKTLLPQRSPLEATLALEEIAARLIQIKSHEEIAVWFSQLADWHDQYDCLLKERTKNPETKRGWWYTHGNLRRTWRLLTDNPKPFFQYLDQLLLPHSNNSLEGTISQATNKLIDHRGMKLNQQVAFLNWYFTFTRVKNKQNLKKLWDYWKGRL
ncbi:hypothetical protein KKE75_04770 [Patescibacteria group bacterium]|nr:hypothetical protein [Patescibacteria group bacterium]